MINQSSSPSPTPSTGSASSTRWVWIGLVVVVLAIAVIAFVGTRSDDSNTGSANSAKPGETTAPSGATGASGSTVVPSGQVSIGSIVVTGANLPERAAAGPDPAVGQVIPTIVGETFDGSAVTIGPSGEPTIIMVVAHWCPHCQREVPLLQSSLNANGAPEGVRLVAIATANDSTRPNFPAGPWLLREKWTVPTMVDDKASDGAQALGVTGFPYFVVVDAQGKVIERTSGELTASQWEALITAAKTGTAQPSA
jgi:thiol-disulfide isomerase/thioredoxin